MPEGVSSRNFTQVAIVVRDIEKSSAAWARVLGVEKPSWHLTDGVEKTHGRYRGMPLPGKAKLAFFDTGACRLELIEPVGGDSVWKEHLDAKGEGVQHLALFVKDTEREEKALGAMGYPTVQKGDFTGGRYSYVDVSKDLGVVLEFLQNT